VALISLEDLRVSYGDIAALCGVTCSIDGGAVGLLGPNAAGKSTLLKALLGFVRAQGGSVEMFGKTMPRHALEVRQKLGYMPEQEIVSPKVSAVSFLTYCGRLYGMSRVDAMERAHEVLNYVDLADSRYRKMETYSTGMCQRVKFAQALVHDPKLLLLDEPTSGMDPEGRGEMLDLIRELNAKRGVTVLLSTHLLPDVEHVCDRVVMIHEGNIVLDQDMAPLMAAREGAFEVRVRDYKEAFLSAIEHAGFSWRDQHNGNVVVTKPPGLDQRALFEIARAQRTHIRHFRPVHGSLEEAFLRAVGATAASNGNEGLTGND